MGKNSVADGEMIFGFIEFNKFVLENYDESKRKQILLDYEQTEHLLKVDEKNLSSVQVWDTLVNKGNVAYIILTG